MVRMPALRDRWAGAEAGVRKPPKNEPAGSGEWFAVYGDFVGQRLRRGMILAVALRAECRWQIVKGFGCRPYVIDGPVQSPASESLRRTNPREAASGLPSMGILSGGSLGEG